MKQSSEIYGKEYFERGIQKGLSLYENYHWLPDLTIPMAKAIVNYAKIMPNSSILDVGCAKGYLVKAFTKLGFDAWGIDISKYAWSSKDSNIGHKIVLIDQLQRWPFNNDFFNWVITKDTLEHLTEKNLDFVLYECSRIAPNSFHIIPLGDGVKYYCRDYDKDVTHNIRQSMKWWVNKFIREGFNIIKKSYRVKGIKDRWYPIHPKGNGFFVIERRNQ